MWQILVLFQLTMSYSFGFTGFCAVVFCVFGIVQCLDTNKQLLHIDTNVLSNEAIKDSHEHIYLIFFGHKLHINVNV